MSGATVKGSSDGTTAAMDGTDRIGSDPGTIVASPLKWIVIDLANMSGGFEILLSWTSASQRIYVSPNGTFTGGTTSARPTGTDEDLVNDTFPNSANTIYTHFMSSSDGKSFMYFTTGANIIHCYMACMEGVMACEAASSLDTVWFGGNIGALALTFPTTMRAHASGANASVPTYGGPYFNPAADAKTAQGGAHIAHEVGLGEVASPDGLIFSSIIDVYKGGVSLAITGDGAPSGGTREWIHFGQMLVPWNGAALTIL